MKSKIARSLVVLFVFFIFTKCGISCTMFYFSDGDKILAGNNEDWRDSNTKIWTVPPTADKNGWIYFGFENGYPQGGINDKGVFWDGTANAYLAMPESEANKQKYTGNVMQKVLEECSNIDEAIDLLSQYYCEDQYKAQYLVGDALGNSIIVEGDNILRKDSSYQVLTNFYHSHPELGGYPCWRHERACNMLSGTDEITPYFVGTVLAATHQDGKYPTQYSNIYDFINGIIYLFYFHNFEEFIKLSVQEEVNKGSYVYKLPDLFSKVKMISPVEDQVMKTTTVTFRWEGKKDSNYEVIYSTDPDFKNSFTANVNNEIQSSKTQYLFLSAAFGLLIIGFTIKRKNSVVIPGVLLILTMFAYCGKSTVEPTSDVKTFTKTVSNLQPNTYYWKVKATTVVSKGFSSETITSQFRVESK